MPTKNEIQAANTALDRENTLLRTALIDMHFAHRGAKPWDYETSAVVYDVSSGEESEIYQVMANRLTSPSGGYVLMISGHHNVMLEYLDTFLNRVREGSLNHAFLSAIYAAENLRSEKLKEIVANENRKRR